MGGYAKQVLHNEQTVKLNVLNLKINGWAGRGVVKGKQRKSETQKKQGRKGVTGWLVYIEMGGNRDENFTWSIFAYVHGTHVDNNDREGG
jgi:hypothetical protein